MAPKKAAPMKRLISRDSKGHYRKIDFQRVKTINGKKYDRTILKATELAVKGAGDGRISVADTKMICRAVRPTTDGKSTYDPMEKATMAYVRKSFKFTDAADKAMRAFIAKMGAKQAARTKAMKVVVKRPATAMKASSKASAMKSAKKPRVSNKAPTEAPEELKDLKAWIVNLERRPDRWERVSKMLKKEVPWLPVERFLASDGTKNPIPEEDISLKWNTKCNANFADYYEWVYEDGTPWMWAADAPEEDETWKFQEDGEDEFMYIRDAPTFNESPVRTGTLEKKETGEKFKLKLQFANRFMDPGETQLMSGGERGCASSHLRLWRMASDRAEHTLVLEDDVHLTFDRTGEKMGKMNGKVFTERLAAAVAHAPNDFDVIYLGWSGWRGGHFKIWKEDDSGLSPEDKKFIQKAEYVWTTVAYVLSQAGAKKLLSAAGPIDQPVDNFMACEASQGRLKSFVALDAGDEDDTWAGGIVDQFDFQGDSDIKKSDGGHQGDDAKEFAAAE